MKFVLKTCKVSKNILWFDTQVIIFSKRRMYLKVKSLNLGKKSRGVRDVSI